MFNPPLCYCEHMQVHVSQCYLVDFPVSVQIIGWEENACTTAILFTDSGEHALTGSGKMVKVWRTRSGRPTRPQVSHTCDASTSGVIQLLKYTPCIYVHDIVYCIYSTMCSYIHVHTCTYMSTVRTYVRRYSLATVVQSGNYSSPKTILLSSH